MVIILIVASLLVREQMGQPLLADRIGPVGAAAWTLLPMLLVFLLAHALISWQTRRLARWGSWRSVLWAERVLSVSRWLAVGLHVFAVLALGWLDAVRSVIGDRIVIDEVIAGAPVMAFLALGWWSVYPIDRLLREAAMVRGLDEGLPIHAPPSRVQYVVMQIRHQMLLGLVPMTVLAGWSEGVDAMLAGVRRAAEQGQFARGGLPDRLAHWTMSQEGSAWAHLGLQLVGVGAVFSLMPLAVRWLWDTVRMDDGAVRARLAAMCGRHGVRIRDLLVWRTRGTMANGAVLGLLGRLRFVLLTDALLERLPERQVEAVMAHEVGHVRHRHIPWLAAVLFAAVGGTLIFFDWALITLERAGRLEGWQEGASLLAGGLALGFGLVVFGFVSRRFEWQADSFAVQHLSGAGPRAGGVPIADEAVEAMVGALDAVSTLNHIPRQRFTWRHGSIATRMHRLARLRGQRADTLPIDQTVRRIKWVCLVVLAAVVGLSVWQSVS